MADDFTLKAWSRSTARIEEYLNDKFGAKRGVAAYEIQNQLDRAHAAIDATQQASNVVKAIANDLGDLDAFTQRMLQLPVSERLKEYKRLIGESNAATHRLKLNELELARIGDTLLKIPIPLCWQGGFHGI